MTLGHKQTLVGNYFERLAHQVLGGKLVRNEDGDLVVDAVDAFVEIKASGMRSNYGFRLSVPQIERCEKLVEFPFARGYYMLFAYRNLVKRVDGRRVTELSRHNTQGEVDAYLRGSILWCLMVDMSIVTRWKLARPKSHKSVMGHPGAVTVDIRCRDAVKLTGAELRDCLRELALEPREYGRLSGKVELGGTSFVLSVVLPDSDATMLQGHFLNQGHCLMHELFHEEVEVVRHSEE